MKLSLDKSYNFLVPYKVPMIRLGDKSDGGYVISTQASTADTLISLGLGTNWSFDKDWLKLNPNTIIHGYDGTIDPLEFSKKLKQEYDLFFKQNAVQNVIHFKENVTIDNIDKIFNRAKGNIFLKMDIEGDEYSLISSICQRQNLVGMVIEFHNLDFEHRRIELQSTIDLLDNYKIVHVHANNYGGINNDLLPHTLEISFLRKDLCNTTEKRYDVYLPNLDFPNLTTNEDYMLYFIGD